jgi:purine-nucleoside phosphorylase
MNQPQPTLTDQIAQATAYIRTRTPQDWQMLIVLGSGLGPLADEVRNATRIPYHTIPGFAQSTVPGHSGQFVIGDLQGVRVAVMQGRTHFYEGHPVRQTTLPIRVAKAMGVSAMIVTNAAGGINRGFNVADIMLITDHINFLGMAGNNPLVGPNDESLGPRFPQMTDAYDATLQRLALDAARGANVELKRGVYFALAGPFFETPAELRFLRAIGADAVGMSTANEVVVARHAGIRVLGFSSITNVARLSADEGEPPSHQEVMEAAKIVGPKLSAVVQGVLKQMA